MPLRPSAPLGVALLTAVLASSGLVTAAPTPVEAPYPSPPARLPGRGLAQHDFLYTGEWDTRKDVCTLFLIRGGAVAWTYQIPRKDETNGQESEFSDLHRLANGDIVFAYKTGWRKIDARGRTLFDYKCPSLGTTPDGKTIWAECHSAQPVGPDKVLFMQNGLPAKLRLYNLTTGKFELEHVMRTKEPVDARSIHGQFRNVRLTAAGTYLIAHMNLGRVIEYDRDWREIWSCDAPSAWGAPTGSEHQRGSTNGVRELLLRLVGESRASFDGGTKDVAHRQERAGGMRCSQRSQAGSLPEIAVKAGWQAQRSRGDLIPMARRMRIQFPDARYHVIYRGNLQHDIFASSGARESFVGGRAEACAQFGRRVYAQVVMRNHYHLALADDRGRAGRIRSISAINSTVRNEAVSHNT